MRRRPTRVDDVVLACCLSVAGLAAVTIRLLADPSSRLSRWVDRNVLPYGATR